MNLIVATNNAHKVKEFTRILKPHGYTVLSLRDAGIVCEADENADTFEGNAYIKAKAVFDLSGLPTVADDSGLSVDALGGAPGVFSARYGGSELDDVGRYEKVLAELRDVPDEQRTARFECAISLILSNDEVYSFHGTCEGKIGYGPHGENGFGYDPIFMIGEKSMAECTPKEKDLISHRGIALEKMDAFLKQRKGETE